MPRVIQILSLTAIVMVFLLGNGVLAMIGWPYDATAGSNLTKIHPSTYVIVIAFLVALGSMNRRAWALIATPRYLFLAGAVLLIVVRAVFITMSGTTSGEFSAAMVSFLTPLLLLPALATMTAGDLSRFALPMRIFFAVDSVLAIGERVMGHRLIPSFLDTLNEPRSAALLSHPLSGSLLTGLMIVHLATARRAGGNLLSRVPELALHTAAMFAFGGRGALVFTATVILLSAVLSRQEEGQARVSNFQRLLPFVVFGVGVILMFLPLGFFDATIDRFTNDGRSSETRNAAIQMLGMLTPSELMTGVNGFRRTIIMKFFGSDFGIELAWIALIFSYGLPFVLPLLFALPSYMLLQARQLDRSAFYMTLMFLATTAGSISFGAKTLVVTQAFAMIAILCQPVYVPRAGRTAPAGRGTGLGFDLGVEGAEARNDRRGAGA